MSDAKALARSVLDGNQARSYVNPKITYKPLQRGWFKGAGGFRRGMLVANTGIGLIDFLANSIGGKYKPEDDTK